MDRLYALASKFRLAIEAALADGRFSDEIVFSRFPRGCCGDSSDLLAQYLLENGIRTYYVCGTHYEDDCENNQSHAWLLTEDEVIIDITADQFKYDPIYSYYDLPIYVGHGNEFYDMFEVEKYSIRVNRGLDAFYGSCAFRLKKIYKTILQYI